MDRLATGARWLHILMLSAWLGAAAFFGGARQTLFSAFSSRHVFEEVRHQTLGSLDQIGTWAGVALMITLVLGWVPLRARIRVRVLGVLTFLAGSAARAYWLRPDLQVLLEAMGRPLEDLTPAQSFVARYLELSAICSWLFWGQLFLSAILILSALSSLKPKRRGGLEI